MRLSNMRLWLAFLTMAIKVPASSDVELPNSATHMFVIPTFDISNAQQTSAMAPAPDSTTRSSILKADYVGSNSTKSFRHRLPTSSVSTTKEKTQYLSTLRESIAKLQDEVNGFLTLKMNEDKALAADAGKKVDDKAEEENYGEETIDDNA